jgi:hypothetical protein
VQIELEQYILPQFTWKRHITMSFHVY